MVGRRALLLLLLVVVLVVVVCVDVMQLTSYDVEVELSRLWQSVAVGRRPAVTQTRPAELGQFDERVHVQRQVETVRPDAVVFQNQVVLQYPLQSLAV